MTKKPSPQIVAAGVIEKDGRILIGKRKHGKMFAGNWEFPGGTVEKGETPEQCLQRELREELAVEIEVGHLICSSEYSYTPEWTIRLLVYRANIISGMFDLKDHEEIRWVPLEKLAGYDFPEASSHIVKKLVSGECR